MTFFLSQDRPVTDIEIEIDEPIGAEGGGRDWISPTSIPRHIVGDGR